MKKFFGACVALLSVFLFSGCLVGDDGVVIDDDLVGDKVRVSGISSGDEVESPLVLRGEALGMWFFEGSFPVELVGDDGVVIALGYVQAKGDWMTEDFVPFEAELSFLPRTLNGNLIFRKDNPSGLPENDAEFSIPVKFSEISVGEIDLVKKYIEDNIAEISPVEPVLGGKWYVLSVEFTENSEVFVEYEDGHILANLTANCSVEDDGEVKVTVLDGSVK